MTFMQALVLVAIGFLGGMFSPYRVRMGMTVRVDDGQPVDREKHILAEIAQHAREHGDEEFARVVEMTAEGKPASEVIANMSPQMRAKWEAFRKVSEKAKKGE